MVVKLTGLTHNIVIHLHLVAESWPVCSSRPRQPVRKLLDTRLYLCIRPEWLRNTTKLLGIISRWDSNCISPKCTSEAVTLF